MIESLIVFWMLSGAGYVNGEPMLVHEQFTTQKDCENRRRELRQVELICSPEPVPDIVYRYRPTRPTFRDAQNDPKRDF